MRKRGFLPVLLLLASGVAMAQPGEVALIAPTDNSGSVALTPTFSWTLADGATSYEIQIARKENMKQMELDATGITGTSYTLQSELNEIQTYFWRVRAVGDANGPWSNVWSFVTGQVPAATSLASPSNQETGVPLSPQLVWNEANGAVSYEIEISLATDFGSMAYSQGGITETSLALPIALDTATRYYWRVRGSNDVGDGPYSSTQWFETVVAKPDQVLLSTPSNGATGVSTTPTLTWEATTGADSYSLEVSEASGFSTLVLDVSGLTSTSFNVSTALTNGEVFYWRVRATNAAGDGPNSGVRDFTTIAGGAMQVKLTSPANGSTDVETSPLLTWGAVQDATSYRVQVAKSSSFSSEIVHDTVVGGTQLKVGPLGLADTYYWRVRATNAGSQNWSGVYHFETTSGLPGQVALDSPSDGAVDQPLVPTLSWSAPTRAETYNLEVALNADFSVILLSQTGLTSTELTLETLEAVTDYYWHVQAENGVGTGPWSSGRKFTTRMLLLPEAPALIYPPDASAGVSTNPVFSWNAVDGADSYKLELSTSPPDDSENFSSVITAVVITQPFFQSPELSPGQEHYWRVEARNAEGSTPSPVWRFRTSVSTSTESDEIPAAFALHQNYPNPFNPSTRIQYDLPESATVELAIIDMTGRRVATLVSGEQPAGVHSVLWSGIADDGSHLASGVYLYRISTPKHTAVKRLVLLN